MDRNHKLHPSTNGTMKFPPIHSKKIIPQNSSFFQTAYKWPPRRASINLPKATSSVLRLKPFLMLQSASFSNGQTAQHVYRLSSLSLTPVTDCQSIVNLVSNFIYFTFSAFAILISTVMCYCSDFHYVCITMEQDFMKLTSTSKDICFSTEGHLMF
jgi:hypothetical protein